MKRPKRRSNRIQFHEWLLQQKDRRDAIGALAEELVRDNDWLVTAFANHLRFLSERNVLDRDTIRVAWSEYTAHIRSIELP